MIVICLIVTSLWIRPGYVIAGGDMPPPIVNFEYIMKNNSIISDIIIGSYYALFREINYESLWAAQWLLILLFISLTAISIYNLLLELGITKNRIILLGTSIWYVFNPLMVANGVAIQGVTTGVLPYGVLALLTLLVIRLSTKFTIKYFVYFVFSINLLALLLVNPPTFLSILFSIILLSLLFIKFKYGLKYKIKIYLLIVFIMIGISLLWTFTTYADLLLNKNNNYEILANATLDEAAWTMKRSNILNVFRLYHSWSLDHQEYYSFNITSYDNNPFSIVYVSFVAVPLLFIKSLSRNHKLLIIILTAVILLTIILEKGINEPFGNIYSWLYDHLPYFWLYRTPKFAFLIVICYVVLFTYALNIIYNRLKSIRVSFRYPLLLSCILILINPSWPIFTNDFVQPNPLLHTKAYVKIPDYWFKFQEWICSNDLGNGRILVLPPTDFYQVLYVFSNNSTYYGTDPINVILDCIDDSKIIIPTKYSGPYSGGYFVTEEKFKVQSEFYNKMNDVEGFRKLLEKYNITHILMRYDRSPRNDLDLTKALSIYQLKNNCINKINEFGSFVIFKVQSYNCNTNNYYKSFEFNKVEDLIEFIMNTPSIQFDSIQKLEMKNDILKYEIYNPNTWGWKTLASPLIQIDPHNEYLVIVRASAPNAFEPHIKIIEYDGNLNGINDVFGPHITSNWDIKAFKYKATNPNIKFIRISIWNGHESPLPEPNIILIDYIRVR